MGKKNKVIRVPHADEMIDETFLLHIEARHAKECKVEKGTSISRHALDAWIGAYRAYHQRLHDIAVPGQYNHVHEED